MSLYLLELLKYEMGYVLGGGGVIGDFPLPNNASIAMVVYLLMEYKFIVNLTIHSHWDPYIQYEKKYIYIYIYIIGNTNIFVLYSIYIYICVISINTYYYYYLYIIILLYRYSGYKWTPQEVIDLYNVHVINNCVGARIIKYK